MSVAPPRHTDRRRGLVFPFLFTLVGLAVLLGLGVWQLDRKTWKEEITARLGDRLQAPPAPLPPRLSWPELTAGTQEFRRVTFPGEFEHDKEALVYGSGSALRPDVSGPGYWIFTPARLAGGSLVIVNRGFVPEGRQDPGARTAGQIKGFVDIVGAMRWPEPRGRFTPADDPGRNTFYVRDHSAIAQAKELGIVAPFYVEQEGPVPPGGLPQTGRLHPKLPNNHLQYALTWFGIACALLGVFLAWTVGRLRRRED